MRFRLKLQLIALPFVILPMLTAGILYSTIMRERLLDLRLELLNYQIDALDRKAAAEYETLQGLGLSETDYFRESARASVVSFAEQIRGPGDILLVLDSREAEIGLKGEQSPDQAVLHRQVVSGLFPDKELSHITLTRQVPELDLVLVAATPQPVIYRPISNATRLVTLISTGIIAVFLLLLFFSFERFVRPLSDLSGLTIRMASGDLSVRSDTGKRDEVGLLAENFNTMAARLETLTKNLSDEVEVRTRELSLSLEELQSTQTQLIESEKMAALGSLVAGISHEINTPIGIGVTAMSHVNDLARQCLVRLEQSPADPMGIRQFAEDVKESTQISLTAMSRAAELISNFKQVAVDQHTEELRSISMAQHIDSVLITLKPNLKKTKVQVTVTCPENLVVTSYPGALWQIISNLVLNSLFHAFGDDKKGNIDITVRRENDMVLLVLQDNGCGMTEEIRKSIFNPFFTTRRHEGGTGLGLHIVYNLVTRLLGGTIECASASGEGTEFRILFPVNRPRNAPE